MMARCEICGREFNRNVCGDGGVYGPGTDADWDTDRRLLHRRSPTHKLTLCDSCRWFIGNGRVIVFRTRRGESSRVERSSVYGCAVAVIGVVVGIGLLLLAALVGSL